MRGLILKWLISCIVIVCLGVAGIYTYKHWMVTQPTTRAHIMPTVTLTALRKHSIPLQVSTYGYTTSPYSVTLRSAANGTIKSIHFSSGQKVKKGQLLFILQASDVTQQLAYLYPALATAKANYLRNKTINDTNPGVVAKQDLLKLQGTYEQLLTQYKQVRAQSYITAPVNGTISDTDLAAGDLVSSNDTLAYISTNHLLQLSYNLPSQWEQQAKIGQSAVFITSAGQSYQAKVSYISPILSPNNQGVALRADLTNSANLITNQFGQIIQTINPKQWLLAVNQSLVQTDAKGYYLFGVQNHKVIKYYFMPGMVIKSGLIIINSGLKAGTMIINSNPSMLSEGQNVQVKTS